jgi:hypothetical protein
MNRLFRLCKMTSATDSESVQSAIVSKMQGMTREQFEFQQQAEHSMLLTRFQSPLDGTPARLVDASSN